jgi:hypothetical protein
MPWANSSSAKIWRKYTWLSFVASNRRGKGKYDTVTEKYITHPTTRTVPILSNSKDQNGLYTKGTPTQLLSPFPLTPHGYPTIPKLPSTCPHFCKTKTFLTWTVITKRREKGAIDAVTSIIKYISGVDPHKEDSALITFFNSWITTVHRHSR